jgi:purine-nucleoside phosphorylase
MPYFDATPTALQRMFGIAATDLPDAAVIVGQWGQGPYFDHVRTIWPDAREIEEHSILVEEGGSRVWISVVFGAAMAATVAHCAARLGARGIVQVGSMGGLAALGRPGDVLIPSCVIGRDGVSRQLSRNRPIVPSPSLADSIRHEAAHRLPGAAIRDGVLVSTTTISLERDRDVARWRRSGFAGVEMEAAATISTALHFGVPAAAVLVLIDNVADGHTFFTLSGQDEDRIATAKDAVLRASVAALVARPTSG